MELLFNPLLNNLDDRIIFLYQYAWKYVFFNRSDYACSEESQIGNHGNLF